MSPWPPIHKVSLENCSLSECRKTLHIFTKLFSPSLRIPVGGAVVVGAAKLKPVLAVLLVVGTVPKRNGTGVAVLEVVVVVVGLLS